MMNERRLTSLVVLLLASFYASAEVLTPPDTDSLPGTWHYTTVHLVADVLPDDSTELEQRIDELLHLSTVNAESCLLTFIDSKYCTFGVGPRVFRLTWKLNPDDCAFSAAFGLFRVKGKLYTMGDNLCLLYPPSVLLMMMRFMCPRSAKRYIDEIDDLFDSHPGMQLAVEFSK